MRDVCLFINVFLVNRRTRTRIGTYATPARISRALVGVYFDTLDKRRKILSFER